jgi:hypothetical protein
MAAVPIKPEYGPTLGRLLSPRWRAASPMVRRAVIASGLALSALVIAAALTLENATFSHAGRVPFSFSYRGLYSVDRDPGGYVKVQRRGPGGRLEDSFAVEPLRLPPYSGELSAELPLFASSYIRGLSARDPHFVLRGEGQVNVNTAQTRLTSNQAYNVFYTTVVEGHKMFGRDVLFLPERRGARYGVAIVMLTAPKANPQVTSPPQVASTGILLRPLKTFSFD